jgi:hypothetical protein
MFENRSVSAQTSFLKPHSSEIRENKSLAQSRQVAKAAKRWEDIIKESLLRKTVLALYRITF